ncbi:LysR family transcriptional regulator [Rhizobacter sp. P5_C2]
MDRLKALAVFKSVVEHGGFSRAAVALDMSGSVVTRTVQDLEALLGVRLLLRTTRSVSPTSVGESVLERATELLASYDELEAFSSESAHEPHGLIRFAAAASYGRLHLGKALAAFRARWPRVSVDLRLRDDPVDVLADDADLALCLEGHLRQSHVARELARLDVGWFASRNFLLASGSPATPLDVSRFDCLVHRPARPAGWTFVHRDSGLRHEVPVAGALQSTHDEVLMEAAVHGAGLVQLPLFMAEACVAEGRLCRVLRDWHADPVSLHLCYPSRRHQPLAVRKLVEHLVEWLEPPTIYRALLVPPGLVHDDVVLSQQRD